MNPLLYYIYLWYIYLDSFHSYYTNNTPCKCFLNPLTHHNITHRGLKAPNTYSRSNKPGLVVGGDLEDSPSIVKEVQTPESKAFADDCWNKGLNIRDAVDILNSNPEKADDSILDNLLFENISDTRAISHESPESLQQKVNNPSKSDTLPVGKVELNPILEDDLSDSESEEDDLMEVDFGLLSGTEISLILTLMKEKHNGSTTDYKSELIKRLEEDETFDLRGTKLKRMINEMDKIAEVFLKLNENVGRNPLNINWIPVLESKIYKFLKERNYTLGRSTWTEDSLILVLKEQNLSEKEVSRVHDMVHSYLQEIARSESFKGLMNIGLMLSGDDPEII